jgi:outer membrane protein OmpA-like peptidoglycan-associated protein
MIQSLVSRTLIAFSLFALHLPATAQDLDRQRVFAEGEKLMNDAIANGASIYAPKTFQNGLKAYNHAAEDYGKGDKLVDVQAELKQSAQYFMKAIEISTLGKDVFASVMKARSDAIAVDAARLANDHFRDAESELKNATNDLEESNLEDAKKEAAKAETIYRSAEYDAIKVALLAPAWDALKKADETDVKNIAPKTIAKAQRLVADVEDQLKRDRYDSSKAPLLALSARREAEHAITLHHAITQIQHGDKSLEDVLVAIEEQFQGVSTALGLQPHFESGFEGAALDAVREIKERETRAREDADRLRQAEEMARLKGDENIRLKRRAAEDEQRIDSLLGAQRILLENTENRRKRDERVRSLRQLFNTSEAEASLEGDSIVVWLRGLSFPAGKSTIDPRTFPLLAKVQEVISECPGGSYVIEGRTRSEGVSAADQALAERRARSVAELLMSNIGGETHIAYHAIGGYRPMENDANAVGRGEDTRIDVVIVPDWVVAR